MVLMTAAKTRRQGGDGRGPLRTDATVAVVAATLWACLANAAAASAANASAIQCDAGWKYLPPVDNAAARCYVLSSTADTRINASVACRGRGGAELLALRTRTAVSSALALFVGNGGAASTSVVSLLDYTVYANGTVVDHNGALVNDCSVCANVTLAPGRAQPACLVAGLAIGGAAAASAFVQDVDCSQAHTYLCSKSPTSGASTMEVGDAMAIFCTVFILANFIFFNGYFIIVHYLKNHPHHEPASAAPQTAHSTDGPVDGSMQDIKKVSASGGPTQQWRSEHPSPPERLKQHQQTLLDQTAVAAACSSVAVRPQPSANSSEALLPREAASAEPAESLSVLPTTAYGIAGLFIGTDDYAESVAAAAKAVREATFALGRVSTPHYPPTSAGTGEFARTLSTANTLETAAGLASSEGETLIKLSSDQVPDGNDRSDDVRESRTSHHSSLPQDGGYIDDTVKVSTADEAGVTQRKAALTDVPARALSAALTQQRNTQPQQQGKLSRTVSRSADHLR